MGPFNTINKRVDIYKCDNPVNEFQRSRFPCPRLNTLNIKSYKMILTENPVNYILKHVIIILKYT